MNRSTLEWAIPAPQLNALWTGLWPRIAARIWLDPALGWPDTYDLNGNLQDQAEYLRWWIEWLIGKSTLPAPYSTGTGMGDPGLNAKPFTDMFNVAQDTGGSPRFQDEMRKLHAYLGTSLDDGRVPIHILPAGGYDFLVSEIGLELWPPPTPQNAADFIDAYEHRRTGRPLLSLPTVMGGTVNFPDAPTGPGQVEEPLDPIFFQDSCLDESAVSEWRYCGVESGARLWLRRLREALASEPPPALDDILAGTRRRLEILGAREDLIVRVEELLRREGFEDALELLYEWFEDRLGDPQRGAQEVDCVSPTTEQYSCKALMRRCWVVAGAVYRGVLDHYPRAVADAWSCDPGRDVRDPAQFDPRAECEQRVETTFRGAMRFETLAPNTPGINDVKGVWGSSILWDKQHLTVTNMGFALPSDIGNLGTSPPLDQILRAITAGLGGNPIFTDTSATT